jgi:hypothetical protein
VEDDGNAIRVTIAGIALIRAVLCNAPALDALKWYRDSPGPVAFGRVCSAPVANAYVSFASAIFTARSGRYRFIADGQLIAMDYWTLFS